MCVTLSQCDKNKKLSIKKLFVKSMYFVSAVQTNTKTRSSSQFVRENQPFSVKSTVLPTCSWFHGRSLNMLAFYGIFPYHFVSVIEILRQFNLPRVVIRIRWHNFYLKCSQGHVRTFCRDQFFGTRGKVADFDFWPYFSDFSYNTIKMDKKWNTSLEYECKLM